MLNLGLTNLSSTWFFTNTMQPLSPRISPRRRGRKRGKGGCTIPKLYASLVYFSLCHGFYLSLFSSSLLWIFSRLVSWSLVEIQLALLTSILKPVNACLDTKPTNAGKSKGAEWNAVRANKMQDAGQCWTRLYHLISCRPGLCFCRDATWLSCAIGHVMDGCLGSCLTNRGRRCGGLRIEMLSGPRKPR